MIVKNWRMAVDNTQDGEVFAFDKDRNLAVDIDNAFIVLCMDFVHTF